MKFVGMAAAAKALGAGGEVLAVRTDVSRADDVEALAAAAVAKFGKVNLLFNNARNCFFLFVFFNRIFFVFPPNNNDVAAGANHVVYVIKDF